MPKKTLLKPMKMRHYAELVKLGNASGMKVRPGVANTGHPGVRTIMNLASCQIDRLVEEASTTIASRRAVKRERGAGALHCCRSRQEGV
jgi:hypothetical protein